MTKRVEAFRLSGRVEVDAKTARRDLKDLETQSKSTGSSLKHLKGDLGGVDSAARKTSGGILSTLGNISEVIQAIPAVGSIIGSLSSPLQSVVQTGLEFNDTIEETQLGLETMLGSLEKAQKHQKELQAFGVKTPYKFQDLARYDAQLLGVGFHAEEILPTLTALGDGLSAVGARSRLDDVIKQLGQMRAKGRASLEELGTIAETGIPVYEILAKQVGMSKAALIKAIESGKVNSEATIEFLLEGMEQKYKGLMDRMSKTRQGALSNLQDAAEMRAAEATAGLHKQLTETYTLTAETLNSRAGVAMAAGVGTAANAVGKVFNTALRLLVTGDILGEIKNVGGNIVSTLTNTIDNGAAQLKDTFKNLAQGGVDAVNKEWKINSPSKVAIAQGEAYVEGLTIGLTKDQQAIYNAMKKLFETDPDFLPKLIRESVKRGIDPDHLLNVIAAESGFRKAVQNSYGYTGLIQLGDKERKEVGMPRETWGAAGRGAAVDFFSTLSAADQLDYVFAFLDKRSKGQRLDTQSKVYATVGAGSYEGDEQTRRRRTGKNPSWDINRDGWIQNWEFGEAAQRKLGAGVAFTVNGQGVSPSNPVPVVVVAAGGDLSAGAGIFRQREMAGGDIGAGAGLFRSATPRAGGDLGGGAGLFRKGQAGAAAAGIARTWEEEEQITRDLIEGIVGKRIEDMTSEEFRRAMRQVQKMPRTAVVTAAPKMSDLVIGGTDGAAAAPIAQLPIFDGLSAVLPVVSDVSKLFTEIKTTQITIDDLLGEEEKKEKKILTTKEKQARLLGRAGGSPGYFTGRKYGVTDKEGNIVEKATAAQHAMAGLKGAAEDIEQIGKTTFASFAEGVGSMATDYILLGDVGPNALRKLTAQVLASASQESLVKGIMATGDGFIHMFTNPAQSAADFTAAGIYFSIAGATGLIGRKVAGDLFKDKGKTGGGDVNQSYTDASNPANNFTRREFGGSFYAGQTMLVGERRPEVVRFTRPGHVFSSVSQYEQDERRQRTSARLRQMSGDGRGMYPHLFERMADALDRFESMSPEDVLTIGARRKPKAVSDALTRSMDSDPNVARGMGRRLGR